MDDSTPYRVLASTVRAASATAFSVQLVSVAMANGVVDWTPLWRTGFGRRFWMGLGEECPWLALACLFGCGVLAANRPADSAGLPSVRWCPWVNVATIAMLTLIPAIAVAY